MELELAEGVESEHESEVERFGVGRYGNNASNTRNNLAVLDNLFFVGLGLLLPPNVGASASLKLCSLTRMLKKKMRKP